MNHFEFETCAQIWKRQWLNHVWNAKCLEFGKSDKAEGYCIAAQVANAMMVISEALKQ